ALQLAGNTGGCPPGHADEQTAEDHRQQDREEHRVDVDDGEIDEAAGRVIRQERDVMRDVDAGALGGRALGHEQGVEIEHAGALSPARRAAAVSWRAPTARIPAPANTPRKWRRRWREGRWEPDAASAAPPRTAP